MGNDAVTGLIGTLPGIRINCPAIWFSGQQHHGGRRQRRECEHPARWRRRQRCGTWPAGFQPATIMNPDMVGEVRMVTSPVDAELGRGNSQVQVQTRSGTNTFRGAAVYNIRNSAIEPNSWANNRAQPRAIVPAWTNLNEYTGSVGGPIVKNKTFFFFLWNGLLPATRTNSNATVLTPCARNGIFRYFDGWNNGNRAQVPTTGATPTIAAVDQCRQSGAAGDESERHAFHWILALRERVRRSAGEPARGKRGLFQHRASCSGNRVGSQPVADGSDRICEQGVGRDAAGEQLSSRRRLEYGRVPMGAGRARRQQSFQLRRRRSPQASQPQDRSQFQHQAQNQRRMDFRTRQRGLRARRVADAISRLRASPAASLDAEFHVHVVADIAQ